MGVTALPRASLEPPACTSFVENPMVFVFIVFSCAAGGLAPLAQVARATPGSAHLLCVPTPLWPVRGRP